MDVIFIVMSLNDEIISDKVSKVEVLLSLCVMPLLVIFTLI